MLHKYNTHASILKNCLRQHTVRYIIMLFLWSLLIHFLIKINNNFRTYFEEENFKNFSHKIRVAEQLYISDHAPNETERIAAIEKELPSIPYNYWCNPPGHPLQKSKDCAKFPSVLKLRYHNKYWQTYTNYNNTIQLYNAYFDKRAALPAGPVVRLLAMINTNPYTTKNQTIYCQLWYDDTTAPSITNTTTVRSIWPAEWGNPSDQLYPHLITCTLPRTKNGTQIPKVVSLVSNACDTASNSLRIHYDIPSAAGEKRQFAVCVKGMDYPYIDISARLVEWIELQLILGASKIYFYQLEVHPNVAKVLAHYRKRGLIDVRDITLAGGEPSLSNLQHFLLEKQRMKKRLNELIPYNDCFYRNLYRYDYIALQDIDEVIMPLGSLTQWSELMAIGMKQHPAKCPNGYASYCFRNIYFTNNDIDAAPPYAEDVPNFMHMLQNVKRNEDHLAAGNATKCFHRTDQVITLHNHFSRAWLKVCGAHSFNIDVAQMHHYRDQPVLNKTITDLSVWRFKEKLLEGSLDALRTMGLLIKRDESENS